MSKKGKLLAISYFMVHFFVEIICFTLITQFMSFKDAVLLSLVFDFFAFVPQIFFGIINTKFKTLDLGTIGVLLMFIGLLIFNLENTSKLIISMIFIGLGNSILHECGAISTVVTGNGKLFPGALFVSGGSFGLVLGKYLSKIVESKWFMLLPLILIEIIVLSTKKYWLYEDVTYPKYNITKKELAPTIIISVATFITFARSFIGYAIPISWNKSVWQTFLLFSLMGIGKAFGGYVSDKYGAKITGILTTLICIPFLILGENLMLVSIIGVFLFSMTMSITYGMLLSVIRDNPGIAFGFTTIGLFLGLMPVFLFGSFTKLTNNILIILLSICSSIGFIKTLTGGEKSNEKIIKEI